MDLTNVPEYAKAGLRAMNAGKPLAELENGAQTILERFEGGENIEHIAQTLQVSPQAVYKFLTRHAEEDWKEQLGARAHWQLDRAEARLETAGDGIEVSRARELLRAQQWRLERVLARVWGQNTPAITVNLNLGDVGSRIAALEQELRVNAVIVELPKE